MLAHILAIVVAVSSFVLLFTAFSMAEIHKQNDFLWSGVGLFYALVLWFCASRITGSVLLGQVAAVALVVYFNWQNLQLRKAIANPDQVATEVEPEHQDNPSIIERIQGFFPWSKESTPPATITDILQEDTDQEITEAEFPEETSSSESSTDLSTQNDELIEELIQESDAEITVDTTDEQEASTAEDILVPTLEEEELAATEDFEPIENIEPTVIEEVISVPEVTEAETQAETTEEFNLEPQAEVISADTEEVISEPEAEITAEATEEFNLDLQTEATTEEKPLDVDFTPSTIEEIKEEPSTSIDDFLAELDNSMDKPTENK